MKRKLICFPINHTVKPLTGGRLAADMTFFFPDCTQPSYLFCDRKLKRINRLPAALTRQHFLYVLFVTSFTHLVE